MKPSKQLETTTTGFTFSLPNLVSGIMKVQFLGLSPEHLWHNEHDGIMQEETQRPPQEVKP